MYEGRYVRIQFVSQTLKVCLPPDHRLRFSCLYKNAQFLPNNKLRVLWILGKVSHAQNYLIVHRSIAIYWTLWIHCGRFHHCRHVYWNILVITQPRFHIEQEPEYKQSTDGQGCRSKGGPSVKPSAPCGVYLFSWGSLNAIGKCLRQFGSACGLMIHIH